MSTGEVDPLLGSYVYEREVFAEATEALDALKQLRGLHELERRDEVSSSILRLISEAPQESFLLSATLDFIDRINQEKFLDGPYTLTDFELWLNQQAQLSPKEIYQVRAKIVGKHLPREEYQAYFPIGMGRSFPGPHFVTAHNPPDLDTTVASFWGWVDAFGAQVADGVHIWNVPSGEVPGQAQRLFTLLFGEPVFQILPRKNTALTVSAIDLLSHKSLERQPGHVLTAQLDHGRYDKLIVLVNEQGCYGGCWRSGDVERFRLITLLVKNVWGWFENTLHLGLFSLFSRPHLKRADVQSFVQSHFDQKLVDSEPVGGMSPEHRELFALTLMRVLGLSEGLEATFADLVALLSKKQVRGFTRVAELFAQIGKGDLFDEAGNLVEDRPKIFRLLEEIIAKLDEAVQSFAHYLDQLAIAIRIKHQVVGDSLHYVTPRAELDEIRNVMGSYRHLTVALPSSEGTLLPQGVIRAKDLQRSALGTVTLRDFCNREEVKIPSYLEVISVVDHHRASLNTASFPTVILGDVQSCNVLLAEVAFRINDRYAMYQSCAGSSTNPRLQVRAAQRQLAAQTRGEWYVHPRREIAEYLSFLHALLDDTDLLDRVTTRDVLCCVELINRLKSLIVGREVESITLEDIPRDEQFAKRAAQRILTNSDMYSLYSKIYAVREKEVELDLSSCIAGKSSNVFADTKEQKGCARVGQTKIFPNNFSSFLQHAPTFRQAWLKKAQEIYRHRPDLDLHLQMITTIPGAEEVYQGGPADYRHHDEIWIWVPPTEGAHDRLASYLSAFQLAPEIIANASLHVDLIGPAPEKLKRIFTHHFRKIPIEVQEDHSKEHSMAILRFDAASITSRKTSITPYIPTLGS